MKITTTETDITINHIIELIELTKENITTVKNLHLSNLEDSSICINITEDTKRELKELLGFYDKLQEMKINKLTEINNTQLRIAMERY